MVLRFVAELVVRPSSVLLVWTGFQLRENGSEIAEICRGAGSWETGAATAFVRSNEAASGARSRIQIEACTEACRRDPYETEDLCQVSEL